MSRKRERGLAYQRRLKRRMEENGWVVHNQIIGGRWGGDKDIFGCVDLVAKKSLSPTVWVQASLGRMIGKRAERFARVPWGGGDVVLLVIGMKERNRIVDRIYYLVNKSEMIYMGYVDKGVIKINMRLREMKGVYVRDDIWDVLIDLFGN